MQAITLMIVLTTSTYILLRAYTLLTFLYTTFNIYNLASPSSGYSITIALVVLGREVELGSVFIVTRSSIAVIAVTPRLINCNIAVALGVSIALDIILLPLVRP